VLALWLARFAVPVRIIDKTAEPSTTSRALAVQSRTLELDRQLGFADEVMDAGSSALRSRGCSAGSDARDLDR
jgi:2-polyprenyl-6-methoxyphenol hydroxylase-like FAD-dependent oxidoreductase